MAEYEKLENQVNGEVQILYARYADIISDILVEEESLNTDNLVFKLSKRLSIV